MGKSLPVLIVGGTDGASVNIASHNCMKGAQLTWLYWAWCFAHKLELACKDALSSSLFHSIDEMLLKLYYVYAKSPKKSKELCEIVEDLEKGYNIPKGGDRPIRSHGSRWISFKCKALQRLVDRYSLYMVHLATLVEDRAVSSSD